MVEVLKVLHLLFVMQSLHQAFRSGAAFCNTYAAELQNQHRINPWAAYKKLDKQPFVPSEGAVHRTDSVTEH